MRKSAGRGILLIGAPLVAAVAVAAVAAASWGRRTDCAFEFAGVTMASWWNGDYAKTETREAIGRIKRIDANYVAIVPTRYVADKPGSTISATANTEGPESLGSVIASAHQSGLRVMLKPHIDALDGSFRGDLKPENEAAWFAAYKAMIVAYAGLAAAQHVELLSIGCELRNLTGKGYREYWVDIIAAVRAVYPGKLIYAAFVPEAESVSFWDKLDYVGVDMYIPLANTEPATSDQLARAWHQPPPNAYYATVTHGASPADWLARLAEKTGKPIVLTELGYRSARGAAAEPWNSDPGPATDLAGQSSLYEAFFRTWSSPASRNWMRGAFLWNWPLKDEHDDTGFSWVGKPAERAVSDAFKQMACHV